MKGELKKLDDNATKSHAIKVNSTKGRITLSQPEAEAIQVEADVDKSKGNLVQLKKKAKNTALKDSSLSISA